MVEDNMKYNIGENVLIKKASIDDLDKILNFQKNIIDRMPNKEFFTPLTEHEFVYPIENNGLVYLLYYDNTLIGLFVLTINPEDDILDEYQLDSPLDVAIFDSVMIEDKYRGYGLQLQVMKLINKAAHELGVKRIVATIHPNNKYSLDNFLKDNYKIINQIDIHGGPRLIVEKVI